MLELYVINNWRSLLMPESQLRAEFGTDICLSNSISIVKFGDDHNKRADGKLGSLEAWKYHMFRKKQYKKQWLGSLVRIY